MRPASKSEAAHANYANPSACIWATPPPQGCVRTLWMPPGSFISTNGSTLGYYLALQGLMALAYIHIQCQRGIWILINVHGGESIFILFWRWLEWDVRGGNGPSADQGSAVNHRFAAEPNFRNVWNAWELNRHRPIISLFTNQQGGDNRRRHRTCDPRKSQTEKFDFSSLNYRGFGQSQFLTLERTDH